MKRILFISLLIIVIGILDITQAPKPIFPAKPKYGGILKIIDYAMAPGPFGLPGEGFGPLAAYQQFCMEALIMENYDASLEPWLATSWKISSKRNAITFELRKGVKFHDGTDFNAEAVKFTYDLLIASGKYPNWDSVEVLNNHSVLLKVKSWQNKIFVEITGARIVSPTAYKNNGADWMRWHMVGTGPFVQVALEKDVKAVYKRFDKYWQKGKPYLDGVEISVIPDPMTQVAAMKAGEADALFGGADQKFADLRDAGFNIVTRDGGVFILIPDSANANSPLSNPKVREAVEYAIDKQAIADALSYGLWEPAYQVIHPGIPSFNPKIKGRKYDPEKSKKLLKEAGYSNGFKTRIITYAMDALMKDIATAAQGYLAEVGIKASLELPEGAKYLAEYTNGTWNNALVHEAMARFAGNYMGTMNYYLNPESRWFKSLERSQAYINQFNKTVNTTELNPANVQALSKVIYDEAMVIPLATNVLAYAVADYVKDADWMNQGTIFGMWRPDNAWLDK